MSVEDWVAAVGERLADSITCEHESLDPADVVEEIEQRVISATGRNLNNL